jgi:hypothetical protein
MCPKSKGPNGHVLEHSRITETTKLFELLSTSIFPSLFMTIVFVYDDNIATELIHNYCFQSIYFS